VVEELSCRNAVRKDNRTCQDTEYNAVVFELFRRIYTWRHIPAERSARPLTVELLGKEGPGILVTK